MDSGVTERHPFGRISATHVLALYALIGGLLSLAGWILDVPWLTDWPGSGISIQPKRRSVSSCPVSPCSAGGAVEGRAGALLGAGVAVVGGLTLARMGAGRQLGIDGLLPIDRPWGQRGVLYPGADGTARQPGVDVDRHGPGHLGLADAETASRGHRVCHCHLRDQPALDHGAPVRRRRALHDSSPDGDLRRRPRRSSPPYRPA